MDKQVFRDLINIFSTTNSATSNMIYESILTAYPEHSNALNVILHMFSINDTYVLEYLDIPIEDVMESDMILFPEDLAFDSLTVEQIIHLIKNDRLVSSDEFYLDHVVVDKILSIRRSIPNYKPINARICDSETSFDEFYYYIKSDIVREVPEHQCEPYDISSIHEKQFKEVIEWISAETIAQMYVEYGWENTFPPNDEEITIIVNNTEQISRAIKMRELYKVEVDIDLDILDIDMYDIKRLKNVSLLYGIDEVTPLHSILLFYLTGRLYEPNIEQYTFNKTIEIMYFRDIIQTLWNRYKGNEYLFDFIRKEAPKLLNSIDIDYKNISKLTSKELSKLDSSRRYIPTYSDITILNSYE